MHWQSRSPLHERDHRISLMPMDRPEGEPGIAKGTVWLGMGLLCLIVWAALFHGLGLI